MKLKPKNKSIRKRAKNATQCSPFHQGNTLKFGKRTPKRKIDALEKYISTLVVTDGSH